MKKASQKSDNAQSFVKNNLQVIIKNGSEPRIKQNNNYTSIFQYIINDSNISCGIHELSGLSSNITCERMTKFLKDPKDLKAFLKQVLKEHIKCSKIIDNDYDEGCRWIIASNNIHPNNSIINSILDELAVHKTRTGINPNTKNPIKLWVL